MKRSTIRLLIVLSALYFLVLYLVRGVLPPDRFFPIYLLAAPLFLVVLVLVTDLAGRATVPDKTSKTSKAGRKLGWDIQRLARQIEVGSRASKEYYDSVLIRRLREVLVEKISLETGMDKERIREILKDVNLGQALLRDRELYRLLYTGASVPGPARVRLLEDAIAAIEQWIP